MQLLRWAAAEWLQAPVRSSEYCRLNPEAKSTIALAFSTDGVLFASTHGDHTVKVFHCSTWALMCTLRGHRRTPWTIKFHPHDRNVLASGSLDETVRVWDIASEQCVRTLEFDFVVSCIAFHSTGELLAVTSGRRIFLCRWQTERAPAVALAADGQGSPQAGISLASRPGLLASLGDRVASWASGGSPATPGSNPRSAGGRSASGTPGQGGELAAEEPEAVKVVILNGDNPQRCVAFKVRTP